MAKLPAPKFKLRSRPNIHNFDQFALNYIVSHIDNLRDFYCFYQSFPEKYIRTNSIVSNSIWFTNETDECPSIVFIIDEFVCDDCYYSDFNNICEYLEKYDEPVDESEDDSDYDSYHVSRYWDKKDNKRRLDEINYLWKKEMCEEKLYIFMHRTYLEYCFEHKIIPYQEKLDETSCIIDTISNEFTDRLQHCFDKYISFNNIWCAKCGGYDHEPYLEGCLLESVLYRNNHLKHLEIAVEYARQQKLEHLKIAEDKQKRRIEHLKRAEDKQRRRIEHLKRLEIAAERAVAFQKIACHKCTNNIKSTKCHNNLCGKCCDHINNHTIKLITNEQ